MITYPDKDTQDSFDFIFKSQNPHAKKFVDWLKESYNKSIDNALGTSITTDELLRETSAALTLRLILERIT